MASNPLIEKASAKRRTVSTEMIYDLADSLNKERFVKGMGRFYRVGKEPDGEGGIRHFLTWDTVRAA